MAPEVLAEVQRRLADGESGASIAYRLGVSARHVYRIAHGATPGERVKQPFGVRDRLRAAAEDRFRSRQQAEAEAVALAPTMSIRDIARELDTSVPFVQTAFAKAGIPSRPIAATPVQYREV